MANKEFEAAVAALPPMSESDLRAQEEVMKKLLEAMPAEMNLGPKLPAFPKRYGPDFDATFRKMIVDTCGADSVFLKLFNKYRELDLEQFRVSWGPDAVKLTQEERAQIMLDLLENPPKGEPYLEPDEWWEKKDLGSPTEEKVDPYDIYDKGVGRPRPSKPSHDLSDL